MRYKKGQALVIQFILFFIIGFSLFLTFGNFFKQQSDILRSDISGLSINLANKFISTSIISLIDTCKNCDYSKLSVLLENTTAGYIIELNLNSSGIISGIPIANRFYTSSIYNLNYSLSSLSGKSASTKAITLTFNRTKNELRVE